MNGDQRVRNSPDESVWLPLRSMASTSHVYLVPGWRNPAEGQTRHRSRYDMLSPSFPDTAGTSVRDMGTESLI